MAVIFRATVETDIAPVNNWLHTDSYRLSLHILSFEWVIVTMWDMSSVYLAYPTVSVDINSPNRAYQHISDYHIFTLKFRQVYIEGVKAKGL